MTRGTAVTSSRAPWLGVGRGLVFLSCSPRGVGSGGAGEEGWGGGGRGRGGLVLVTTAAVQVRGPGEFDVQRGQVLWVKNAKVGSHSRSCDALSALPTRPAMRGRGPTQAHHCFPCACRACAVCELYMLTHDVHASRIDDDSNAPLSVTHAHAEHQREVGILQHHLVCAWCVCVCVHGIREKSGACSITAQMNMDMRCPPLSPIPPPPRPTPLGAAPPASPRAAAAAARDAGVAGR